MAKTAPIKLGIALQGGGSYGSYARGVLTTLFNDPAFNDPGLRVKAISGTSAGAVNAALLAAGLNEGGPQDAITRLNNFWEGNKAGGVHRLMHQFNMHYPNLPPQSVHMMDALPDGYVPDQIRQAVNRQIPDWSKLQTGPARLFINAVAEDPQTKERSHVVFSGKTLSADSVAASAGLEILGGHVIDGVKHFDGAYWRNPCTEDLEKAKITDLLIITLQKKPGGPLRPMHQDESRAQHKQPGHELIDGEFFNHIAWLRAARPDLRVHVIRMPVKAEWNNTSKLNNDPRWIDELNAMGVRDGQKWLKANAGWLPGAAP